jgi:hypothetical protein
MFSTFASMFAQINGFVEKTMVEVEMQKTSDSHVDERQPRLLDSSKSKTSSAGKRLASCDFCRTEVRAQASGYENYEV